MGPGEHRDEVGWEPKDEGITNDSPNCFAMYPEDNDGGIDEIFKTTNGGADWSVLSSGLPADNTINDLAITTTPTKGIKLLAATDDGVYYPRPSGLSAPMSSILREKDIKGREFIRSVTMIYHSYLIIPPGG